MIFVRFSHPENVDHLAWTLAPGYSTEWWVLLCHLAGRLTAPIMWFFIVEGWHYTHDVRKYTLRLFLLALVSHFAYNFCFGIPMLPFREGSFFNQTSVAWSLAWGLVLLRIHSNEKTASWLKFALTILICVISFPSDWSCVASMAILYMGVSRGDFKKQMVWMMVWSAVYALVYFLFLDRLYGLLQLGTSSLASTAFLRTLSMPFLQAASPEYASEVAMTSPLPAFRSNLTPPFLVSFITNLPM